MILQPWEMSYSEALFFDSLNLLHGCYVNNSPATRVSMDFIVRRNPRLLIAG
jgi:ectoine hydroxylase-related dioxygenase (phytanoyl-CoA dioxygenase family)